MKRLPITLLLVIALAMPLSGCITTDAQGYALTPSQQASLAFSAVNLSFAAAEAVFLIMEKDGIEHMPTARAAWIVVQAAITEYLNALQTLGVLAVPADAVTAINQMENTAKRLGVMELNESMLPSE